MGKKVLILKAPGDVRGYMEKMAASSSKLFERIRGFGAGGGPQFLYWLKFNQLGVDPLDATRPLHIIEQINQTATYFVSLKAAEFLFAEHENELKQGLRLNLGTTKGTDIESVEFGLVAGEAFAAMNTSNNDKLQEDLDRMRRHPAKHRYVFYHCPDQGDEEFKEMAVKDGVKVIFVNIRP